MTCLILIVTSILIVLAADDAVTLENRIYDGIDKIHELSTNPPLSMMIYGNSDFENIPLENIISEYIENTDFKKINTVLKVKDDFLKFCNTKLETRQISEYLGNELKKFKAEISTELNETTLSYLTTKKEKIQKPIEFQEYDLDFEDIIPTHLTKEEIAILKNNLEYIFLENLDENNCGIVIAGIDKNTMKGSYCQFEMILNTEDKVLTNDIDEDIDITGSKIKIFAQNEVIKGFLNGIDEDLQEELSNNLLSYINNTLDYLLEDIQSKTLFDLNDVDRLREEIELFKENSVAKYDFEDHLSNMKIENIKKVSEELEGMSKDELVKMSKTLIDITRLNQIIHSERETVGKNVTTIVLSLKNGIEKY